MKLTNVHIIGGTGQMGSWMKSFLERFHYVVSVSGKAKEDEKGLKEADIVVISVPISEAPTVISELTNRIKDSACILDLSSLMSRNKSALVKLGHPAAFIHFLFGPGITSIQNQKIVISINKGYVLFDELIALFAKENAQLVYLSPDVHDYTMAHIQALTHFSNITLAQTLITDSVGLLPELTTPTFLNQTATIMRVLTNNSAELLANIQITNPDFPVILQHHIDRQNELLSVIKENDLDTLKKTYKKIQEAITPKRTEEKKTEVPLSPLGDITSKDIIAFLGPLGTFSHQAAVDIAQDKTTGLLPKQTIYDVFDALANGEATIGIVPAENTTEGTIRETLDLLTKGNVHTNFAYTLQVHQNLLSDETDIGQIKKIYSHPQALAQTKEWIRKHLPYVEVIPSKSTLSEVEKERTQKGTAFIGPFIGKTLYNLTCLAEKIEDNAENITKFYVITKHDRQLPTKTNRTLLFLSIFNRVGILRDILGVFASFNVNLNKIESRPSKEKAWDYYFFVEVEISEQDERFSKVISMLKMFCPEIKVLGAL